MLKDRRRLDALDSRRVARAGADSQALGRCADGIHDLRNRSHADPEPGAFAPRVGASGALVGRHVGKPDPGLRAGPGRGHGRLPAEFLLLRVARRRQAVDAPVGRARREVPGSHVGSAGGGRADLRRRVAGDDRLLGPGGVAALDDHSGTGHAVRGWSLGSQNIVPGVHAISPIRCRRVARPTGRVSCAA